MNGMNRTLVAFVISLVALGPISAWGQTTNETPELPVGSTPMSPHSPLFQRGRDPHVIVQQAQFGLARLKIAIDVLNRGLTPENVQSATVATTEAYYFLRAAHESTLLRRAGRKWPDPMLDLQAEQLRTPRFAVAKAVSMLDRGTAGPKRAEAAAKMIADSIVSLEKALVVLY